MREWIGTASARALALYTLLSVVLTYPLAFRLSDRLLGDGDAWLFVWNMWWMRHALLEGLNPFCTDFIHFPVGTCIFLHTWVFPSTFLAVPLQALFSPITLYNVFALLTFILSGWGLYRLARYLGISSTGAFLAGLAFSFSPYHFAHALGHLNLMSYQWIPFFLRSALQGLDEGWTRGRILRSSGWLVLVGLTDWYYFLFAGLAAGLLALSRLLSDRRELGRSLGGLAIVATSAFLLLVPLIAGMALQIGRGLPPERVAQIYSADVQSFFLPGPVSAYADWFSDWHANWRAGAAEIGTFIPWSVLLLSLIGWNRLAAASRRWLRLWIPFFLVLSLGPHLQIGGAAFEHLKFPYAWVENLPGLSIMRAPIRFHLMTYLAVCLAYGAGAALLVERLRWPWAAIGLGILVSLEGLSMPLRTSGEDLSPFYQRLAQKRPNGPVIDLHYSSRALFYQTVHRRKILGRFAMLSREPIETHEFLRREPVVRELVAENQIQYAANGWPAQVLSEAASKLKGPVTAMGAGRLRREGLLTVESEGSLQVWVEGTTVSPQGYPVRLPRSASPEEAPLLVFRLWTDGERLTQPTLLRIQLDGRDLCDTSADGAEIVPVTPIPFQPDAGLTWAFYERHVDSGYEPETAASRLRGLGFEWIILPYYGNDHFILQTLRLEPEVQDRWIQAYRIPSP